MEIAKGDKIRKKGTVHNGQDDSTMFAKGLQQITKIHAFCLLHGTLVIRVGRAAALFMIFNGGQEFQSVAHNSGGQPPIYSARFKCSVTETL